MSPTGELAEGWRYQNDASRAPRATFVNPWEYVLLVEGALLFASGTVRRHQHDVGRTARPFTVSFSPDGSASGALGEESRGEVWVPVWSRPNTVAEIRQLFGEARASWRGRPAQQAVEFYAATRTLGVARGIDEFVRYGLQQRNGLAFVAVPLDRVRIREDIAPAVRLVARVEDWASRARSAGASAAVTQAVRHFDHAHLAFARDGKPEALRDLLAALTTLELAIARSGRARDKVSVNRPSNARAFLTEFVQAEPCAELRVAVGVASCAARPAVGPARTMRQILLPVDSADAGYPRGRWREADELETVASVDDQPVSEVIRAAISAHITQRKQDEGFQQGLRARIERAQRMLDQRRQP